MKVAVGWDHRGWSFRKTIERVVKSCGHEFVSMGEETEDATDDYPDFAVRVGEAVAAGDCDRGVLLCGSGIGMAIAANKVVGVRAALVHDEDSARMSRSHNDANVVCLDECAAGDEQLLKAIIGVWLSTEAEGGRHARRVKKIMDYERAKLAAGD